MAKAVAATAVFAFCSSAARIYPLNHSKPESSLNISTGPCSDTSSVQWLLRTCHRSMTDEDEGVVACSFGHCSRRHSKTSQDTHFVSVLHAQAEHICLELPCHEGVSRRQHKPSPGLVQRRSRRPLHKGVHGGPSRTSAGWQRHQAASEKNTHEYSRKSQRTPKGKEAA